MQVRK